MTQPENHEASSRGESALERGVRPRVRYVLHPGYVTSATDGQEHFIGGPRLAALYGVDIRDRWAVVFGDEPGYREQPGDVHLHPRNDGNYSLPAGPNTTVTGEVRSTES